MTVSSVNWCSRCLLLGLNVELPAGWLPNDLGLCHLLAAPVLGAATDAIGNPRSFLLYWRRLG